MRNYRNVDGICINVVLIIAPSIQSESFDVYNYVVSNIWIKYKIERKVGTAILFVWPSMEITEIGCL